MDDSGQILKLNNQLFDLNNPVVMGILNLTPDSFYQKSRFKSDRSILSQVEKMLEDGASILDLGGYSTRPNAEFVSQEEEISRVAEALEIILKKFPEALISVDTFRSSVARYMVEKFGVAMINDISGGVADPMMFETIAGLQVAYVLMHSRGNPQTMQNLTHYDDPVSEVLNFLAKRVAQLHLLGVHDVVIDPGFGFAKTTEQNYEILNKLTYFNVIKAPLLAGISRKSMIYKILETDPEHALNGTTALNMLALMNGAGILRVHDVKEANEAIKIFHAFNHAGQ
jgi:dihydropteroate synthase